jgi:hypothetical protein
MMEATVTDTATRRRVRFSLLTLLLLTALLLVSVSHFVTSRRLDATQAALRQANNDLGQLTVDDANKLHAISLPTFQHQQWRWRVQLPSGQRYRLRWLVDNVPQEGVPQAPRVNQIQLIDQYAKPIATGEPFILTLALTKNAEGQASLTFAVPNRSTTIPLKDQAAWAASDSGIGWSTWTAGMQGTESVVKTQPMMLLRYRRGKEVPGGWTVEKNPTEGIAVWIEPFAK